MGRAFAGGVAFGVHAYRKPVESPILADLPPGASSLNPFVLIDATGITLITPRADVGQGAVSIQTHLLAEELDVDPRPFAPVSGRCRGPTTTPESRPKAFRWPHGTKDLRRVADGWPGPSPPSSWA